MTLTDGTVYEFEGQAHGFGPHLVAIQDRHGNRLTITRNPNFASTWEAWRVTTPNGRWVEFTHEAGGTGRVVQARDNAGRAVSYSYDTSGRLLTVTDPAGGVTEYTYDGQSRMATLKDARGIVYLTTSTTRRGG